MTHTSPNGVLNSFPSSVVSTDLSTVPLSSNPPAMTSPRVGCSALAACTLLALVVPDAFQVLSGW